MPFPEMQELSLIFGADLLILLGWGFSSMFSRIMTQNHEYEMSPEYKMSEEKSLKTTLKLVGILTAASLVFSALN